LGFVLQWIGWNFLPFVDCLPYKVGNNIITERKIPAGAIADSTVISFVYQKEGREVEFDADHFPPDFSDSLYQFVKRYDKLVRQGNAEPPIKDFVLVDANNNDSTEAILTAPGKLLILFSQGWDTTWKKSIAELSQKATESNTRFIVSTASADMARQQVQVPVMQSDLVAIRTAARVDPTIYLLENANIIGKWALADMDGALKELKK